MSALRGSRKDLTWTWVLISLLSSSVLSAPFLIDGISYFKVAVALILISFLMPKVLTDLLIEYSWNKTAIAFFLFFATNLYLIFLYLNSYRGVFGAPGRHNGLLNGVVCIYFFLIGIYAKRHWH
jgi:hypothetical protein